MTNTVEDLLLNVAQGLNAGPQASVVELSTKLALLWADEQRPTNKQTMQQNLTKVLACYNEVLTSKDDLSSSHKIAIARSASKLTEYWFQQNRSASFDDLCAVLKEFMLSLEA